MPRRNRKIMVHFEPLEDELETLRAKYKDVSALKPVIFGAMIAVIASGLIQLDIMQVSYVNGSIVYPPTFVSNSVFFLVVFVALFAVIIWWYKRRVIGIPSKKEITLSYNGDEESLKRSLTNFLQQEASFTDSELEIVNSVINETTIKERDSKKDDYVLKVIYRKASVILTFFPDNDDSWMLTTLLKNFKG